MTSAELTRWMAYDEIEPFGPVIEDFRWARQAAHFAEANRNRKKRGRAFSLKEFQLVQFEEKRITGKKEMIQAVQAYAAAGIGRIEVVPHAG